MCLLNSQKSEIAMFNQATPSTSNTCVDDSSIGTGNEKIAKVKTWMPPVGVPVTDSLTETIECVVSEGSREDSSVSNSSPGEVGESFNPILPPFSSVFNNSIFLNMDTQIAAPTYSLGTPYVMPFVLNFTPQSTTSFVPIGNSYITTSVVNLDSNSENHSEIQSLVPDHTYSSNYSFPLNQPGCAISESKPLVEKSNTISQKEVSKNVENDFDVDLLDFDIGLLPNLGDFDFTLEEIDALLQTYDDSVKD